jgi:hypothetical protein
MAIRLTRFLKVFLLLSSVPILAKLAAVKQLIVKAVTLWLITLFYMRTHATNNALLVPFMTNLIVFLAVKNA